MVAARAENLKKLPIDKDEWISHYKNYVLTEARAKLILDHLQGEAEIPALTGNTIKHQELHMKEMDKFKQREAAAWKFIYDICDGTTLKPLIAPYEHNFDHVRAWYKIVDYYEAHTSHAIQQSNLEQKIDKITVDDSLELLLAFHQSIAELEKYFNALISLPDPYTVIYNYKLYSYVTLVFDVYML